MSRNVIPFDKLDDLGKKNDNIINNFYVAELHWCKLDMESKRFKKHISKRRVPAYR